MRLAPLPDEGLPPGVDLYGLAIGLDAGELVAIQSPREELTEERIAEIVSREIDQPIRLERGIYRTREIHDLNEFWPTHAELASRPGLG